MKVTTEIDVTDCRDCPFTHCYTGHGECWTGCKHPKRSGHGYDNTLWGCQEQFKSVPTWCPLGLGPPPQETNVKVNGTSHEPEAQRICRLLVYALGLIQKEAHPAVRAVADGKIMGGDEILADVVPLLELVCSKLPPEVLYNGLDGDAVKLSEWWKERRAVMEAGDE